MIQQFHNQVWGPKETKSVCQSYLYSHVYYNTVHHSQGRELSQVPVVMPVISATWEAEIWRIMVQDQPGQIVHKTPSLK
jgi:hypothetical protein